MKKEKTIISINALVALFAVTLLFGDVSASEETDKSPSATEIIKRMNQQQSEKDQQLPKQRKIGSTTNQGQVANLAQKFVQPQATTPDNNPFSVRTAQSQSKSPEVQSATSPSPYHRRRLSSPTPTRSGSAMSETVQMTSRGTPPPPIPPRPASSSPAPSSRIQAMQAGLFGANPQMMMKSPEELEREKKEQRARAREARRAAYEEESSPVQGGSIKIPLSQEVADSLTENDKQILRAINVLNLNVATLQQYYIDLLTKGRSNEQGTTSAGAVGVPPPPPPLPPQ